MLADSARDLPALQTVAQVALLHQGHGPLLELFWILVEDAQIVHLLVGLLLWFCSDGGLARVVALLGVATHNVVSYLGTKKNK